MMDSLVVLLMNPMVLILGFILGVLGLAAINNICTSWISGRTQVRLRRLAIEEAKWSKGLEGFAKTIAQAPYTTTKDKKDDYEDPDSR